MPWTLGWRLDDARPPVEVSSLWNVRPGFRARHAAGKCPVVPAVALWSLAWRQQPPSMRKKAVTKRRQTNRRALPSKKGRLHMQPSFLNRACSPRQPFPPPRIVRANRVAAGRAECVSGLLSASVGQAGAKRRPIRAQRPCGTTPVPAQDRHGS